MIPIGGQGINNYGNGQTFLGVSLICALPELPTVQTIMKGIFNVLIRKSEFKKCLSKIIKKKIQLKHFRRSLYKWGRFP